MLMKQRTRVAGLWSGALWLLLSIFSSSAMSITDDELRAAFLLGFAKHVSWHNEAERDYIVIGFYPPQENIQAPLERAVATRKIRGKTVRVQSYKSLSEARHANILMLAPEQNASLGLIATELNQSNTLLVTEQVQGHLHTMINLFPSDDGSFSFEVHRPNIIVERISLDKDIVLLGGTELDIARIYKETEVALTEVKASLQSQEKQQREQKLALQEQEAQLRVKNKELERKSNQLQKLDRSLQQTQQQVNAEQARINILSSELLDKEQALQKTQVTLREKIDAIANNENLIKIQQAAIAGQLGQIDEQETLINNQFDKIQQSNEALKEQKELLFYQQLMLASLGFIVLITFFAIYSRVKAARSLADANRQLSQTSDELRQANQAKSVFLSTMSHEIRTPMNGVLGMAELLNYTDLDEEQRRYLAVVKNSSKLLLSVISDILDYSKIEAGQMELEFIDFNLSESLYQCASAFTFPAHEKSLGFNLIIDPELPAMMRGDSARLNQILNNFLSNAFKFTETGRVQIFADQNLQNKTFRIGVRDTGKGLSAEQKSRIFTPFAQAEVSTTRRYGGTGLGLSISLQLAKLMGGQIDVESELGEGATFWLQLPLDRLFGDIPAPEHGLEGLQVFVLEQHSDVGRNLCEHLQRFGVDGQLFSSVDEVLDVLATDQVSRDKKPIALLSDNVSIITALECQKLTLKMPTVYLNSSASAVEIGPNGPLSQLHQPVTASMVFNALADVVGSEKMTPVSPSCVRNEPLQLPQYSNARVLVAEDNSVNRTVISGLLKQYGIVPVMVENGLLAIEALQEQNFDLVLMDCEMPVLDGYDACKRYRGTEAEGQHLAIIALTAHAMEEHREQAKASGMTEHLAKPIVRAELERVLATYCGASD